MVRATLKALLCFGKTSAPIRLRYMQSAINDALAKPAKALPLGRTAPSSEYFGAPWLVYGQKAPHISESSAHSGGVTGYAGSTEPYPDPMSHISGVSHTKNSGTGRTSVPKLITFSTQMPMQHFTT